MQEDPFAVLADPALAALLREHHRQSSRQLPRLWLQLLPQLPRLLLGRPLDLTRPGLRAVEDRMDLAIRADQGAFCYLAALSLRANVVVEFGTSHGISTIWLAAALRRLGRGRVLGTEIVPEKAERARQNLARAGLADWATVLDGDARDTLRTSPEPVDLVLMDGSSTHALEVLQLLAPKLRPGALVVTDNVGTMPANYQDYRAWLERPDSAFASITAPYKLGTLVSVKLQEGAS